MKIAVILTKNRSDGGAFQYALSISRLLKSKSSDAHRFIFFTTDKSNIKAMKDRGLEFNYLRWSDLDRALSAIADSALISGVFRRIGIPLLSNADIVLRRHRVDLAYFLNPSDMAPALGRLNFIFTVWDLAFRDFPEFPEVYADREFERRNVIYGRALGKAVGIVTDSELTGRKIARIYGVDPERITPVSFSTDHLTGFPAAESGKGGENVMSKYDIRNRYVFYPAQFWPHKNHVYILEGIALLKKRYNVVVSAVFTGSDKGNLDFVLKRSRDLGISGQVHYLGFVGEEEMPHLYRNALALVMPSYFGPTNIPPLEAFAAGCPVLYPDLKGLREELEGAVLPVSLDDPDSMCRAIMKIIDNSSETATAVANGRKKIEALMKQDRWGALKNIFDGYAAKLRCWKREE